MMFSARRAALAACIVLVACHAQARPSALATGEPPSCNGHSLIDELQRRAPDRLAAAMARAAQVPNGEGLLWRVEKRGVPASYLFGTMHATDARAVALPDVVRDALAKARTVVREVSEPDDPDQADATARKLVSAASMPSGDALSFLTDAVMRSDVESAVGEYGMAPESAHYLRPWFLYVMLSIPGCEFARQQAGLATVDQIVASARARGARLTGLETADEQIATMTALNEAAKPSLVATARLKQRRADLYATLIDSYVQRRIPALREVLKESGLYSPDELKAVDSVVDRMVVQRNARLAARALPFLGAGHAFIAVGALHLSGGNGLVAQFRQAGYAVTRVW